MTAVKLKSAGLVVYRFKNKNVQVILGHIGGPWMAKKDIGAWSIPKGLIEDNEDPLDTAKREFQEELGIPVPEGNFLELDIITQHNNKTVIAWAVEADIDVSNIISNTFETEWPPKSGKKQIFPEVDRAEWFSLEEAAVRAVKGQGELILCLAKKLGVELKTYENTEPPVQNSLF